MRVKLGMVLALCGATAGFAQVTGKDAKAALFKGAEAEVDLRPEAGLPEDQAAALVMVGAGQPYYGAIAISPDEGLMSEATVAAANHHTVEAAEVAAQGRLRCQENRGDPLRGGGADPALGLGGAAGDAVGGCVRRVAQGLSGQGRRACRVARDGGVEHCRGEGAVDTAVGACNVKAGAVADCVLAVQD